MENILSAENVKQLNSIDSQLIEQFFNFACQFVINCFKAEKSCQVDNFCLHLNLEEFFF